MEQLSENENFWGRLKSNKSITYKDIEGFIYTKEYITAMDNNDYCFNKEKYNKDLYLYSFEVEDYETENDYKEVFFQRYIESDITEKFYKQNEDKFIMLMKTLFENSETLVFYTLEIDLENSTPVKYSNDVLVNIEKIKLCSNRFVTIDNWDLFKQICYIAAREIDYVYFIFPDIQVVLINSGLHGKIISNEPLNSRLTKKIRAILRFSAIKDNQGTML